VSRRLFDDQEIRDIVATCEHPVAVVRGERIFAVNDAWLVAYGYERAQVEGQSFVSVLADPDRDRLLKRALMSDDEVSFTRPLRTVVKTGDGGHLPVSVYTSRFAARVAPGYRVSMVLPESKLGIEPTFGRELLELSADLIGAESQDDVRSRTCRAFERAGLAAAFWRRGAQDPKVDAALAARALDERAPVFSGSATVAESVFVPVARDEVLCVSGPDLTAQHAFVFGFFAKLVATALLDVSASEAARRKLSDTQLLLQLAQTTSETLDLGIVMGVTADSLVQLLDVSSCFILLYDEQAHALRGGASSHRRRDVVKDIAISLDDPHSIAAEAARERRVIAITDARADPRAHKSPLVTRFNEKAVVALPIVSRGRLEGVVILDDTTAPRTFAMEWVELATAMVAQVGLSLANARLYESLRRSYDELAATRAEMVKRERLAGLGELAAIVAHEVRNPLGVIYNATTSLKRLSPGSADAITLIDIVREECERLNHIVGDLLDFARPNKLSLNPEEVSRILGDVVEAIGTAPNMKFEVAIDDDLPLVVVDRRLMRQALLNVALNAVQAMPRGGTLHMRAYADTEMVVVEVTDEGPGIPNDDLPRIFEPFYTTKATGAGLGLAVVKRIVEDHGGQVTVTSSPAGTTFRFRLPPARAT
jgi:two-component system, NtrC family, sensor histidine kinase HydH